MGQCASSGSPFQKGKSINRSMSPVRRTSGGQCNVPSDSGNGGLCEQDLHAGTHVKSERPSGGFVRRWSRRFSKDSAAFIRRGSAFATPRQTGSSATFSIDEGCFEANPLNINEATVEELMTLQGVTRLVAESIIAYRKSIGGFRRPEDVALVNGVGAARFQLIRDEICVGVNGFKRVSHDRSSLRSFKYLNVNKATIFDLMTIPGVTQELAAAIVAFREKKGSFRSLQDLQKVKGITLRYALSLRPYLSVGDSDSEFKNGSTNGSLIGNEVSSVSFNTQSEQSSRIEEGLHFTAQNGQVEALASALDSSDAQSLCQISPVEPIGKGCFRIGSWNLEDLSCDKVNNPGVREVVCRTILANSFSLVMLQGVLEEAAVKQLCDYLNLWKRRRYNAVWDYLCSSSGLAIVYLNGHAILEDIISTNGSLGTLRSLQLVKFKVFDSNVALVNCYVSDNETEKLIGVLQQVEDCCETTKVVAAVSSATRSGLDSLTHELLPTSEVTDTRWKEDGNASAKPAFDSIFVSKPVLEYFTKKAGVITSGLTHLAIPKGWKWGGPASNHCPIWADFISPI